MHVVQAAAAALATNDEFEQFLSRAQEIDELVELLQAAGADTESFPQTLQQVRCQEWSKPQWTALNTKLPSVIQILNT